MSAVETLAVRETPGANGYQPVGREWSEVVTVTPAMAERWLTECRPPCQRPLKPAWVAYLVHQIKGGRLRSSTIKFCHLGGRAYLTDGQHRLTAIAEAGIPVSLNVHHIPVATYEQVAWDYMGTDRGEKRGEREIFRAASLAERTGLTDSLLRRLSAGVTHIMNGFRDYRTSNVAVALRSLDVKVQLALEWAEEGRKFFTAIHGNNTQSAMTRALLRSPVVAVGLVTYRYRPVEAEAFWSAVGANDGLRVGQPEHTLIKHLLDNPMAIVGSQTPLLYSRRVAAAWNAYMGGRSIVLLKTMDHKAPITIKGTPYNGKRDIVEIPDLEEEGGE